MKRGSHPDPSVVEFWLPSSQLNVAVGTRCCLQAARKAPSLQAPMGIGGRPVVTGHVRIERDSSDYKSVGKTLVCAVRGPERFPFVLIHVSVVWLLFLNDITEPPL